MKTLKTSLLFALTFVLVTNFAIAQNNNSQAYSVHEDQVKPSMIAEYEKTSKELIAKLKEHNIQDVNWLTSTTQDGRYLYVTPIDNMADLDKRPFAALAEKMGGEAMGKIFDDMNKCYNNHGSYVIHLDKNLTYMPEGITLTPEGENYRRFFYLHVKPKNYSKLVEKMKAIKELYTAKGSKVNYRVYHAGFGVMGNYIMVAAAATNGEEYEKRSTENNALLGEEGKALFDEMFKLVSKFEAFTGSVRPDLGYSPE
jgi:hypothetical protein